MPIISLTSLTSWTFREPVFSVRYDRVLYVIEMTVNIQWINLTSLTLLRVLLEIMFFLVTTIAYNTRFFACVVLHMFRSHEIEFNTWFLTGSNTHDDTQPPDARCNSAYCGAAWMWNVASGCRLDELFTVTSLFHFEVFHSVDSRRYLFKYTN
jgi:hypothetical protein